MFFEHLKNKYGVAVKNEMQSSLFIFQSRRCQTLNLMKFKVSFSQKITMGVKFLILLTGLVQQERKKVRK